MRNAVFYSILIIGFLTSGMISAQGKQRQMEALDRGLVAVKTDSGVFISWRLSGNERDAAFNVYKNGKLFKSLSAGEATNLTDNSGKPSDKVLHLRLLAAGILHQLQNLCHSGITKLLCDLHPPKAAAVDTAADHVVSLR